MRLEFERRSLGLGLGAVDVECGDGSAASRIFFKNTRARVRTKTERTVETGLSPRGIRFGPTRHRLRNCPQFQTITSLLLVDGAISPCSFISL
jgi:hypothetical protein